MSYVYAHSRHETVYPAASAERGQPPPPARTAERGALPQPDPHLCSCQLWETTLVSEWVEGIERPVAWLSLDKGENDPTRFLTYLVAALQTFAAHRSGRTCPRVGSGVAYMSGCPHTRLSRTARKQSIKPKREHCSSLTTPTKQHPNQHFRVSTCRPSWSYATGRSSKWDRRR